MLHADDRLPSQLRRILHRVQGRRCPAVEYDIEPVIVSEALRSAVFVRGQGHLADASPAFNLDETGRRVYARLTRVWLLRKQVVATILRLDALDDPAERLLVRDGLAD